MASKNISSNKSYNTSISRIDARNADQFAIKELKIPGIVLMENAGRGCAEKLLMMKGGRSSSPAVSSKVNSHGAVVVLCGSGNNGGDGFVIARHLYIAGVKVKVMLFSPPEKYTHDAATNLRIIERFPIEIVEYDSKWDAHRLRSVCTKSRRTDVKWIVDAILGTGATGELRDPLDRVIPIINELPVKRLAVDIPTGMDCDTGIVHPTAFRADLTCTFIGMKSGFANPNARHYLGHVNVIGIGAPDWIVDRGMHGQSEIRTRNRNA